MSDPVDDSDREEVGRALRSLEKWLVAGDEAQIALAKVRLATAIIRTVRKLSESRRAA